ncbi:hypothetical protein ACIRP2_35265 [Streptomyces sp. NPDC101194]|uniref:hypothetical protein n=1 Tax=Streptomyces sp. NPDC101194 TaxID=3366127 RepID=UPI0038152917
MTGLLVEVGRRLAERWLSVLVLPGLLLVAALSTGLLLGQGDALSAGQLSDSATDMARRLQADGSATVLLTGLAALLCAGAAGLAAQGLGRLVRAVWLGDWPRWAAAARSRLSERRSRQWHNHQARLEEAVAAGRDPSGFARSRNRISLAPPVRPTWMGDRLAGADVRVFAEYRLDLAVCWPRLWLVLPDEVRAELRIASGALDAAAVLAGWAVLYACAGVVWWPASLVAVAVYATGWYRARLAAATFADLIESTVDLYGGSLCTALGLTATETPLTAELGAAVTSRCRKGA